MLGKHLSQKLTLAHPYNPLFGQKRPLVDTKMGQKFFWLFLSKDRLNLWARYSKPKRKKSFFFSELQELKVRICEQPNFPIIILILLNGFHKFARSRELNSSGLFFTIVTHSVLRSVTSDGSDRTQNDPGHPDNEWG